jgi:hypothetical protein
VAQTNVPRWQVALEVFLVNRNVNVSIDFVKVGGLQKNQALSDV